MTALADLERRALLLKRRLRTLGRSPTPDEMREITRESSEIRQGLADAMVGKLVEDRPEVLTHGTPYAARAAKRGQDEARARLAEKREFKKCDPNCPAARAWKGVTGEVRVHCGVEDSLLSSRTDPQSVLTFCMGDHLACPSWIAEKEAIAAGRDLQAEIGTA